MALPDFLKIGVGTPIIFGKASEHNGAVAAANNFGNITVEMDLADLAAGNAYQSDKFDFGEFWDIEWTLSMVLEWETSPEVANTDLFENYLAYSPSATAANLNPAAVVGVDGTYAGNAAGSLVAGLQALDLLRGMPQDNVINTDSPGVQKFIDIATFRPTSRFATLVSRNQALENNAALHSDMVEMSIMLAPLQYQVRDLA